MLLEFLLPRSVHLKTYMWMVGESFSIQGADPSISAQVSVETLTSPQLSDNVCQSNVSDDIEMEWLLFQAALISSAVESCCQLKWLGMVVGS